MNWRTTAILFLAFLALGAFVWFYEIEGEAERTRAAEADKRLYPTLEAADVSAFELVTVDGDVRLERSDAGWRVVAPLSFPADSAAADGVASALADLVSDAVFDEPEALANYGLEGPARVRFTADGETHELRIGDATPVGSNLYLTDGHGERVFAVPTYRTTGFEKSLQELRDGRFLDFDREAVTGVVASWPEGEVELVHSSEDDGWRLVQPIEAPADVDRIEGLLSDLQFLRAERFLDAPPPDAELGLDTPRYRIEIRLSDRPEPLTLLVGGLGSESRALRGPDGWVGEVPAARVDDLPARVAAFRFKELSAFDSEDADRFEIRLAALEGGPLEIVGSRSETGWNVSPQAMAPGKASRLLSELSHLVGDDVLAEDLGEDELAGLGLAPPLARFRVLAAPVGSADAEVLAEVRLGTPRPGLGIPAQRDGDRAVFLLPGELLEHLPVDARAWQAGFVAQAPPPTEAGTPPPTETGAPLANRSRRAAAGRLALEEAAAALFDRLAQRREAVGVDGEGVVAIGPRQHEPVGLARFEFHGDAEALQGLEVGCRLDAGSRVLGNALEQQHGAEEILDLVQVEVVHLLGVAEVGGRDVDPQAEQALVLAARFERAHGVHRNRARPQRDGRELDGARHDDQPVVLDVLAHAARGRRGRRHGRVHRRVARGRGTARRRQDHGLLRSREGRRADEGEREGADEGERQGGADRAFATGVPRAGAGSWRLTASGSRWITSSMASWIAVLLATTSLPWRCASPPCVSLMRPPASSTIRLPAATSHGCNLNSQNPSKASPCDVAQVEGGAAIPAQRPGALQERRELRDVVLLRLAAVVREARRQQGAIEGRLRRDADRLAVSLGAAPGDRRVELVEQRVVHRRDDVGSVLALEADGDAEARVAVGVVRGAVERVDDPAPRRTRRGPVRCLPRRGSRRPGRPPLEFVDDEAPRRPCPPRSRGRRRRSSSRSGAPSRSACAGSRRPARASRTARCEEIVDLSSSVSASRPNRVRALRVVSSATFSTPRPWAAARVAPTESDVGGLVASAAVALGREQRRVGLDQQALDREPRRDAAQPAIALEREDPAERDPQVGGQGAARERQIVRVAMQHALHLAPPLGLPDVEQLLVRVALAIPDVDRDRQVPVPAPTPHAPRRRLRCTSRGECHRSGSRGRIRPRPRPAGASSQALQGRAGPASSSCCGLVGMHAHGREDTGVFVRRVRTARTLWARRRSRRRFAMKAPDAVVASARSSTARAILGELVGGDVAVAVEPGHGVAHSSSISIAREECGALLGRGGAGSERIEARRHLRAAAPLRARFRQAEPLEQHRRRSRGGRAASKQRQANVQGLAAGVEGGGARASPNRRPVPWRPSRGRCSSRYAIRRRWRVRTSASSARWNLASRARRRIDLGRGGLCRGGGASPASASLQSGRAPARRPSA